MTLNPHDLSTWPVTCSKRGGTPGTIAEMEYYGQDLVYVRYRKLGKRIVKTVEIVVPREAKRS